MLSDLFARMMASQRFRRIAGYIGLAVALLAALWLAKTLYDRALIAEHDSVQETAVLKADAAADDKAGQVAATEQAKVEKENQDARKAAAGSDDPLKSAFDQLRKRPASNR